MTILDKKTISEQEETKTITLLFEDNGNWYKTIVGGVPTTGEDEYILSKQEIIIRNSIILNHKQTYYGMRTDSYPAIGDQLDALWHAMDENILPRVEPFYTDIKTVKDSFPKL